MANHVPDASVGGRAEIVGARLGAVEGLLDLGEGMPERVDVRQ
jgi:hypothetical protein